MSRLGLFALLVWLLASCTKQPRYLVGDDVISLDLEGRWQLVNYWAVWCRPCRKEIPELNQLAEAVPSLAVLGVNFDRPPLAQLQRDRDALAIGFPVLASGDLALPRPSALPTSYLINPAGETVAVLRGEQTYASLAAAFSAHGLEIPAQ
ncbi:TlpA family protein disulfide reductase [Simiduia agarivorans]|uniref:Alkyl hydroperoxide reductase n=1 Tax=Simiduia agarivorans (strain DSM 21679 / JCM 13881 / BCRC 17597 / SA1) TaxID=1117647 RepID=K4KJE0_SIMAS|nr:TlpA disulfide reductase family protein [Simiduia agarivorans]AFU98315.1 alkyl hydroperoxide reductase [Simiduia agarivorans SA1 = DSM 21679]